MDIENQADNQNESNESIESQKTEINQEVLAAEAKAKKASVKKNYTSGREALKDLAQKAMKLAAGQEAKIGTIKNKVGKMEGEAMKLMVATENKIDQEAGNSTIERIPTYDTATPEAQLVEMVPASEKIQKRFDAKISPDMKEAIATVCGQAFNKCKYPYALIGSNCYVPHTKYSAKIPDDLDVIFGIKDLDTVYSEMTSLQEQGLVKDLGQEELKKFGAEPNGCVKIHCLIKTSTGWKEMEAFGQYMHDEIVNQNKPTNGLINLGAEQQTVELVNVNGIDVPIGSEATAEELYLKNTINEFALFDLDGWQNKGNLNAKALQRIFNLINLDGRDFANSIDSVIEKISRLKPPTEQSHLAQASIQEIWDKFKTLPKSGAGLVNHLMERGDINVQGESERATKILTTEKAVDIITNKTDRTMRVVNEQYKYLDELAAAAAATENPAQSGLTATISELKKGIDQCLGFGNMYKEYIKQINSDNKNDFCAYVSIPRLRNHFIKPVVLKLLAHRKNLEAKLTQ